MRPEPPNPSEFSRGMSLTVVGLEMVVPVAVGVAVDSYMGWGPWATVGGTVGGLVGGLTHLVRVANRPAGNSGNRGGDGRAGPPAGQSDQPGPAAPPDHAD